MTKPEPTAGDIIRELYTARGLNRHRFAKRVGAAYTTVSAWETRGILPTRDKVKAIHDALDLTKEESARLTRAVGGVVVPREDGGGVIRWHGEPTWPTEAHAVDGPAELDAVFSRAFRPGEDSVLAAAAVVRALAPAERLILDDANAEKKARGYLDAGRELVRQGRDITIVDLEHQLVRALSAALDAAMAEIRAQNQGPRRDE